MKKHQFCFLIFIFVCISCSTQTNKQLYETAPKQNPTINPGNPVETPCDKNNYGKEMWEKYKETAHGAIFGMAKMHRSYYGRGPWFVDGESLVYLDGELVALRYHMAFVVGPQFERLRELEKKREATHIIRYNIKKEDWVLEPSWRLSK